MSTQATIHDRERTRAAENTGRPANGEEFVTTGSR